MSAPGSGPLTHPDEALRLIQSLDIRLETELVCLERALGRIPARGLVSAVDQPPFDKATMDGFAYARVGGGLASPGEVFVQASIVAAGSPPSPPLRAGECSRVMTGACLPEGACAVHRLELASVQAGRVTLLGGETEPNIVRRGANSRAGEELFGPRPLRPQDLGILAANGLAEIEVVRKPRVAVLGTGNELRAAGQALGPGLIYDSNGPMLAAQAEAFGCEVSRGPIVPDDEDALREAIDSAALSADLVLVSGGVSAGDYDFVPRALELAGFALIFRRLALRPGMPALLGRRGGSLVYGMPGNPVSAFVNFEVLAKPLLRRLSGLYFEPVLEPAIMGGPISRRDAGRVEFLPLSLSHGVAGVLRYTGSTMLDALSRAQALLRLELGQDSVEEGAQVHVRRI